MSLVKTLKRINLKSFWQLVKLGLRNPLFIIPTIKATKQCLKISTNYFGRLHHKNTSANAFRHALWNYLIAKKCTKWSKKVKSILQWTKDTTDWHENAFVNRELARKMDVHNNAIGRAIFEKHPTTSLENVILLFLGMAKKSIHIKDKGLFEKYPFSLVHLTN